jgi:hypothetical protein
MATPLAKRLQVKPGHKVLAINAPKDYSHRLGDLPDGARLVTRGDLAGADHDDTWSALRFKAVAEAGRRGERQRKGAAA